MREFCITPLPPWNYPDAKIWACTYTLRQDIELPKGINKTSPQIASLTFASYKETSIGPYDELLIFLIGEVEGKPVIYCPLVYVSSDEAFLGGRDVWGFPKRMGKFSFEKRDNITTCQLIKDDRCLVAMEIEELQEANEIPYQETEYFVTKRIIDAGGRYVKRQLIRMKPPLSWKKIMEAKINSLNFYPTDKERVGVFLHKEILSANTATVDMQFVFGEIFDEQEE